MTSEVCVQIRLKFDNIILSAKTSARDEVETDINKPHYTKLSLEQKVQWFHDKMHSVWHEISEFEPSEYYCLAYDEKFLLRIYSSRVLCNNNDEGAALWKGIKLHEKYRLACQHYMQLKEQLPPLCLNACQENIPHMGFYEPDESARGTEGIDTLTASQLPTLQKENGAIAEFTCFKNILLNGYYSSRAPEKFLAHEFEQLKRVFHHSAEWDEKLFVREFFKLEGVKGLFLSGEPSAFYSQGICFLTGDRMNDLLTPYFWSDAMKDFHVGKLFPFPLLGLALYMYYRWLEGAQKQKGNLEEFSFDPLHEIFDDTFIDGVLASETVIESFENENKLNIAGEDAYEAGITREMDKMWEKLNNLKYAHYFFSLDQVEKAKGLFIEDCLYSVNIERQKQELKEMTIMNEMIAYFNEKSSIMKHNPLAPMLCKFSGFKQLSDAFSLMAPDSALLKQYTRTLARIKNRCGNENIPLYFISKDIEAAANILFNKAVKHLKHILESMPPDNRGYFINNQLREMIYQDNWNKEDIGMANPFKERLKQIFLGELDRIEGMKAFKAPEINTFMQTKDHEEPVEFSFGLHKGPYDLKNIFQALQLQINLFKDPNAFNDFWEVFTSSDLSKNNRTFLLGCQTNQLKLIMELTEEYAANFNPASIERSGLFISKKGKPVTANTINASTTDVLRRKRAILNIFQNKR